MDTYDIECIEQRARFVEEIHEGTVGRVDPEVIDVALDAVPDDRHNGFVVVWMPYREGDYVAKVCSSHLGVAWYTWRARCQRSIFTFVLDIDLVVESARNRQP